MRTALRFLAFSLTVIALIPVIANAQTDAEGSQDPPGMTRMPAYYIRDYQVTDFDSHSFKTTVNNREQAKAIEGKHYEIRYDLKDNVATPSPLQVVRNYQNAAKAAGGQILFTGEDETTIRIVRGGSEEWIALTVGNVPSGVPVMMTVIVKRAMAQEVTMDAAQMASSISDAGQVAIYGIYFDIAKSDLKPESDPAVAEIAKLLASHPGLKVYIVGHTDMVGDAASNLKLSQARAQSVVAALTTKYAIPAPRLTAFGAGPYAPVASNRTEDGRAKNRRVDLVEIATN
ncbi:MAG TPA: OmpA family protein [Terracidiphilus sp.]|jgi:outer membrane protein OmpA-like peptidoglycan-associated protein